MKSIIYLEVLESDEAKTLIHLKLLEHRMKLLWFHKHLIKSDKLLESSTIAGITICFVTPQL